MDVISMRDFSKEEIIYILDVAEEVREAVHDPEHDYKFRKKYGSGVNSLLQGVKVAALFLENSTRTHYSFRYATGAAQGFVDGFPSKDYTSLQKGETWASTAKMFAGWGVDIIVMRSTIEGLPRFTKETLISNHKHMKKIREELGQRFNYKVPGVINGGDGTNQHPTQCFLDLLTIRQLAKARGRDLDGLHIALLNDLAYGRTNASLMSIAHLFDWTLHLAYPPRFGPKKERLADLRQKRVTVVDHHHNFLEAMRSSFAAYHSRPQKERVGAGEDLITIKELGQIKKEMYDLLGENAPYLMHPLPIDAVTFAEISADLDFHEKNVTSIQSENGLYIRIALLALLAGKIKVNNPLTGTNLNFTENKELKLNKDKKELTNPRSGYIEGDGIVLDHIPSGLARRVEGVLGLEQTNLSIVSARNLFSNQGKRKDILKIHGRYNFSQEQYEAMALVAPSITINFVENGKVARKIRPILGNHVVDRIKCGNNNCVSNCSIEPIKSRHAIEEKQGERVIHCHYCEMQDSLSKIYEENRFKYLN